MWLAILLVLGIVLCIVGLVWGVLWIIVPALLLIAAGAAFHFSALRSDADATGRLEKGPAQDTEGRGGPEDSAGGPTHTSTGVAHGGQRHMTP